MVVESVTVDKSESESTCLAGLV